jgi:quinoprotein glucose dehydrogenase
MMQNHPVKHSKSRRSRGLRWAAALVLIVALSSLAAWQHQAPLPPVAPMLGASPWDSYGGDAGGQRYAPADQITPANIDRLEQAWVFHTGDEARGPAFRDTALEVTPILVEDSLVLCTAFDEVVALDPGTGEPRWRFDPKVSTELKPGNHYVCRGVAYWRDKAAAPGQACAARIFIGTVDSRLIALDARNGRLCGDFGEGGQISIDHGPLTWPGEFQITSPPAVTEDRVIIGSSISDAWRVEEPNGAVRAFDPRTGRPIWAFDPLRPDPAAAPVKGGAANVWAPISVDARRGLVFLPTTSPSPDFYGGQRPGSNGDADSVVALSAATGAVVWRFQTIHHDVWDYDLPAQPSLVTLRRGERSVDAVVQVTKTGFIFVLDRDTGQPLFPVIEQPVPQDPVAGEILSPTQPMPTKPAPLVPQTLTPDMAWGLTPWDRAACRRKIAGARSDGLFTPPSLQGSIAYPFEGGGANWGGAAFDPASQLLYINTSSMAHLITLFPIADLPAEEQAAGPKREVRPQQGAPFGVRRELLVSPLGLPCNPPPWGTLTAVDLTSGDFRWQVPLGTVRDLAPVPLPLAYGVPNLGGPVVTAGGVVFIGAAMDDYLRAFDARQGSELWRARLPAGGQATPMVYGWKGREYVVIAAGGSARLGTRLGDSIMAFALPMPQEK